MGLMDTPEGLTICRLRLTRCCAADKSAGISGRYFAIRNPQSAIRNRKVARFL